MNKLKPETKLLIDVVLVGEGVGILDCEIFRRQIEVGSMDKVAEEYGIDPATVSRKYHKCIKILKKNKSIMELVDNMGEGSVFDDN